MPTVTVNLASKSYDIVVENGILEHLGKQCKSAGLAGRCAVITDANVSLHYDAPAKESLAAAGYEMSNHLIPPGEASKSMEQVQHLCRSLIEHRHDRSSWILALGGGVVGDIAGFVAAILYRGIPYVQVPTTIVAQVDSAIGGKTGVNEPEGKNLIGAFHQPRAVFADPETLKTLPARVYREGFAEVIKHAAIRDAPMLDAIEALDPGDQALSADLIARNAGIKARIVEDDEMETTGTRALLNFGHTVGHAIEASVPYGTLLHGEAIALGIRAALHLSEEIAGLDPAASTRLLDLLAKFNLPLSLPEEISTSAILAHLRRDKKFIGGQMTFVLLDELGHGILDRSVTETQLEAAIAELRLPR
ncbi:MAG: 3-dehydroquinate synthase [Akkermansiaceae bacterium]|nr:3-dehydroquinate synthase [Akkermansiaceae bacterium]NNM29409.1 3-dehydroquinate synthase [Akkermansiaceae bacterium]